MAQYASTTPKVSSNEMSVNDPNEEINSLKT
jgi:hypothetical protein